MRTTEWARYMHDDLGVALPPSEIAERAVDAVREVPRGKPAPDVYLRALELLHASARDSAAVEDSANGIRSAAAAGLAVIAIPNRAYPPDADALACATTILATLTPLDASLIANTVAARNR